MKPNEFVVENYLEVLRFLKSRFPMYHLSNFFFRDVQYGIMSMLEERGVRITYPEAEGCAWALIGKLEREKIFSRVDHQTWVVNFPEFRIEPVRPPAAPAKPAPGQKPNPPGSGAES